MSPRRSVPAVLVALALTGCFRTVVRSGHPPAEAPRHGQATHREPGGAEARRGARVPWGPPEDPALEQPPGPGRAERRAKRQQERPGGVRPGGAGQAGGGRATPRPGTQSTPGEMLGQV